MLFPTFLGAAFTVDTLDFLADESNRAILCAVDVAVVNLAWYFASRGSCAVLFLSRLCD